MKKDFSNVITSNQYITDTLNVEKEISLLDKTKKETLKQIKERTIGQYALTMGAVQRINIKELGIQETKVQFLEFLVSKGMTERKATRLRTVAFSKNARQQFNNKDTALSISKFLAEKKLNSVRKIESFFTPTKQDPNKVLNDWFKQFENFDADNQEKGFQKVAQFMKNLKQVSA